MDLTVARQCCAHCIPREAKRRTKPADTESFYSGRPPPPHSPSWWSICQTRRCWRRRLLIVCLSTTAFIFLTRCYSRLLCNACADALIGLWLARLGYPLHSIVMACHLRVLMERLTGKFRILLTKHTRGLSGNVLRIYFHQVVSAPSVYITLLLLARSSPLFLHPAIFPQSQHFQHSSTQAFIPTIQRASPSLS